MQELTKRDQDIFNRLIATDNYLSKYLPYNMFTQLLEIMHVALTEEQLKRLQNYESAKLQTYLADILLDLGRHN